MQRKETNRLKEHKPLFDFYDVISTTFLVMDSWILIKKEVEAI